MSSQMHKKSVYINMTVETKSHKRSSSADHSFSSLSSEETANDKSTVSKNTNPPKDLRSGIRAENVVHDEDSPSVSMGAKDIVKIFTTDKEYTEVTHEQVERVKKSECISYLAVCSVSLHACLSHYTLSLILVHKKIEDGVNFSFNFNVLLLVSSILAGLGLVSDNSTTIIASMLVSPIMGPVVGLAYGTTICDWKLVKRSLRNECISLLICIVVGVAVGGITGNIYWIVDDWPTYEMTSRCDLGNLIISLPVAFVSGLGVAVSLFDDQMSSLVGVAISASLLPPAVNSGIIWIGHVFVGTEDFASVTAYGMVSLGLTVSNIILIWISSMLMFRIKEVLPIEKSIFWSDLGIARKLYQKKALIQLFKVDYNGDPMAEDECTATVIASDEEIEIDIEGCRRS